MKRFVATAAVALTASAAYAGDAPAPTTTEVYDPTFFLGFTWAFGNDGSSAAPSNNLGFGIKYLSTNQPDTLAGAIGLTYYFDGSFGCDIGAALNHGAGSLALTYDFCRNQPQLSLGGINQPDTVTTAPPAIVAASSPPT